VAEEVRDHFHVFDAIIPRNVRLSEAPSHGKPALLYDAECKGAQGYLSLAHELLQGAAMHTDRDKSVAAG
jgi:chromosome partitioning protein